MRLKDQRAGASGRWGGNVGRQWWATVGLALVGWMFGGAAGLAAPLPPFTPVDVCGAVVSSRWEPEVAVAGKPGFSGSLGRDRVFPAHFEIVLGSVRGIDAQTMAEINNLVGSEVQSLTEVTLLLPNPEPGILKGVRSICVYGFDVRGDEGGTWTSYTSLILDPPE